MISSSVEVIWWLASFRSTIFYYLFTVKTLWLETVTLGREAREYYHLPKVNSQTSGGKEVSYFSNLDWLQAKSNRKITSLTMVHQMLINVFAKESFHNTVLSLLNAHMLKIDHGVIIIIIITSPRQAFHRILDFKFDNLLFLNFTLSFGRIFSGSLLELASLQRFVYVIFFFG
jgi:hypothetical protein